MSDYRTIPFEIVGPFLRKWEAEILRVYDDKVPRRILKPGDKVLGVLTAGIGHTGGLVIGQRVTRAMSTAWLKSDLIYKAAAPLMAKVGPAVIHELTDHQYAALLAFVFNLGTGNPKKREWTIWQVLRQRRFDQVPLEMMKFTNDQDPKTGKLRQVQGLVNRRSAEVVLWSTREPGSVVAEPPSSVTRREVTPPTPADPVPAHKDAGVIAAGGAGALGLISTVAQQAPDTIKQGIAIVRPYADDSPLVGNAIATLSATAAGLAFVVFVLAILKKRRAQS